MLDSTAAIVFVTASVSFFLGRASAKVLRDKYLESKRDELMAIKSGLDDFAEDLTRREEELRAKWQKMIVSASEITAYVNGSRGTWTAEDAHFLDCWSSAEGITEAEE